MKAFLLAVALIIGRPTAFPAEQLRTGFARPFPIVMFSTNNATPRVKELALKVSKAFGLADATAANTNPVCCVWLEITRWTPNPGTSGFIIIHQGGGTLISASTPEQLELAVDRFIKSAKDLDGKKIAPVGLMTNYGLVQ